MRTTACLMLLAWLALPAPAVPQSDEPERITVQHILIAFKGSIPNDPKVTRSKEDAERLAGAAQPLAPLLHAVGGEPVEVVADRVAPDSVVDRSGEHLVRGGRLMDHVVQSIHHDDAFERVAGERERFRESADRLERGRKRLFQHPHRNIGDDNFIHQITQGRGDASGATAHIEQSSLHG